MPTRSRRDLIDKLPDQETEPLQLEIETPNGVFVRTIRPAAFLPDEFDRVLWCRRWLAGEEGFEPSIS